MIKNIVFDATLMIPILHSKYTLIKHCFQNGFSTKLHSNQIFLKSDKCWNFSNIGIKSVINRVFYE